MGVASPFWMQAIDTAGTRIARTLPQPQTPVKGFETTTRNDQPGDTRTAFVDPALAAGALGKPAPQTNPGARY